MVGIEASMRGFIFYGVFSLAGTILLEDLFTLCRACHSLGAAEYTRGSGRASFVFFAIDDVHLLILYAFYCLENILKLLMFGWFPM